MAFQWKERYSLKIPEIDAQHKRLFEIGEHAYELASLNDDYDHFDEIRTIINELLEYTQYHFKYEEEFMSTFNYPDINDQITSHNFYVNKIKGITDSQIDDDQHKAVLDILDFLAEWISSHILISDRKYADYYFQHGNKA